MYPEISVTLLQNHLFFNTTVHNVNEIINAFAVLRNAEITNISIKANHFIDVDVLHHDLEYFKHNIEELKENQFMVLIDGKTTFVNVFELEHILQEREKEVRTI